MLKVRRYKSYQLGISSKDKVGDSYKDEILVKIVDVLGSK